MNRYITIILVSIICLASCVNDKMPELIELDNQLQSLIRRVPATGGNLNYYELPGTEELSKIPQDVKNPLNPAKVKLGKLLFFETAFSRDAAKLEGLETYSCGSCHIPSAGFKPGSFQGIADGGEGFGIKGEDRRRSAQCI